MTAPVTRARSRRRPRCLCMRAELSPTPARARGQSAAEEAGAGHAPGIAGDAPDRHVDPVAGHGPLFLRLAAPEAVLPVLPGPGLARCENGTGQTELAGLGLAAGPGLGPLTGRGEEEIGLAVAGRDRLPPDVRGADIADVDDDFRSERRRHGEGLSEGMRIPDVDNFLTTSEINAMHPPDRSDRRRRYVAGSLPRRGQALTSRAVGPGLHGLALTPGIPGDPAHRHLDPEPGGGSLLL